MKKGEVLRILRMIRDAKVRYMRGDEEGNSSEMMRARIIARTERPKLPPEHQEAAGEDVTVGELEEYIADLADDDEESERYREPEKHPILDFDDEDDGGSSGGGSGSGIDVKSMVENVPEWLKLAGIALVALFIFRD